LCVAFGHKPEEEALFDLPKDVKDKILPNLDFKELFGAKEVI
jgi:hypothetical protein